MAKTISFQEKVQERYFDQENFSKNYDRMPVDKQQRIARMALGFLHSQSCEQAIPDEVVEIVLKNLDVKYKELLIDMVNEQVVDGGKEICQRKI